MASPFAVLAVAAVGLLPPAVAIALMLTTGPAGLLPLTELNTERPPQRRSGNRLTSRTLTGERTVDLSRIERVLLLTHFSRGGVSERVLLVRDTYGMSIGLLTEQHMHTTGAVAADFTGECHRVAGRSTTTTPPPDQRWSGLGASGRQPASHSER